MANISINNLAKAIYESSRDKSGESLSELSRSVVNFLSEKRLLGKSKELLVKLERIVDRDGGIVRAKVSSKEDLNNDSKKEVEEFIKDRYKRENTIITFNNDPNLLGGVKIEVEDEVIDITLRNKINKLKNYLITN